MYGAWEKAKNNGVTKEQAQKNYVDLVKKLATRVGYEEGYKPKLK